MFGNCLPQSFILETRNFKCLGSSRIRISFPLTIPRLSGQKKHSDPREEKREGETGKAINILFYRTWTFFPLRAPEKILPKTLGASGHTCGIRPGRIAGERSGKIPITPGRTHVPNGKILCPESCSTARVSPETPCLYCPKSGFTSHTEKHFSIILVPVHNRQELLRKFYPLPGGMSRKKYCFRLLYCSGRQRRKRSPAGAA
jgi:hypothetical protein